MIPEDIEKLIGGYATGTLSEDERRQLFEAALENQELFNALHDEHALKQLLDDPASRELVRRAAVRPVAPSGTRWFRRPWVWAAAASMAMVVVLAVALVESRPTPPASAEIAQVHHDVAALSAPPPASLEAIPQPAPKLKSRPPIEKPTSASQAPILSAPITKEQGTRSQATVGALQAPQQQQPAQQTAQVVAGFRAGDQMQPKQSVFRSAPAAAAPVGAPNSIFYTLSHKMPDGTYRNVTPDIILQEGDTVRVTVLSRTGGPLTVWQSDAAHPTPKRIFPIDEPEIFELRALENYTVPLDILVTPGEHLRVEAGSSAVEIAVAPLTK